MYVHPLNAAPVADMFYLSSLLAFVTVRNLLLPAKRSILGFRQLLVYELYFRLLVRRPLSAIKLD